MIEKGYENFPLIYIVIIKVNLKLKIVQFIYLFLTSILEIFSTTIFDH
jgi:hypothetical protein